MDRRLFRNSRKEFTKEAGKAISPKLTIYVMCTNYPPNKQSKISLDDSFDDFPVYGSQIDTEEGPENKENSQ